MHCRKYLPPKFSPDIKEQNLGFINCQIFLKNFQWDPENSLNFYETALAYSLGCPNIGLSLVGMTIKKEVDSNIQTVNKFLKR